MPKANPLRHRRFALAVLRANDFGSHKGCRYKNMGRNVMQRQPLWLPYRRRRRGNIFDAVVAIFSTL
jgi:hypothetical protein